MAWPTIRIHMGSHLSRRTLARLHGGYRVAGVTLGRDAHAPNPPRVLGRWPMPWHGRVVHNVRRTNWPWCAIPLEALRTGRSQRTEKVENRLLISLGQGIEADNHRVRFRRAIAAGVRLSRAPIGWREMRPDSLEQIARAAIMQEEQALPYTPQGGGPKHVAGGRPLRNVIGQARPHVMDQQIRKEIGRHVLERRRLALRRRHHLRCMAREAPNT